MEDGWKVRMNIYTPLYEVLLTFAVLSQSKVSTDNRKVSTHFAFQHVLCRCCYRSYLDRFLKKKIGMPLNVLHGQVQTNLTKTVSHITKEFNGVSQLFHFNEYAEDYSRQK